MFKKTVFNFIFLNKKAKVKSHKNSIPKNIGNLLIPEARKNFNRNQKCILKGLMYLGLKIFPYFLVPLCQSLDLSLYMLLNLRLIFRPK